MQIPPRTEMQDWTLLAMQRLGGSGHNREIEDMVKALLRLPDAITDELRPDGQQTVLNHRIAFARSHLKAAGLQYNPQRAVWMLTETGAARASGLAGQIGNNNADYEASAPGIPDAAEVVDDSETVPERNGKSSCWPAY